jgi:hypothetical protein
MAEKYTGPVSGLLKLGKLGLRNSMLKVNYRLFWIRPKHIPDLIRLAVDEDLYLNGKPSEACACIHAWRALGDLHAAEAVAPLTRLLYLADAPYHNDWVLEDLPRTFGRIGPAAIPVLLAYGRDPAHGIWARMAAIQGLVHVAKNYPEQHAEIVRLVREELAKPRNKKNAAPWEDALIDLGVEEDRPNKGVQALRNPLR